MQENPIVDKSFEFAVRIVNLYKYLTKEHKEYVLSKQLLRSGTSIGANVSEAQRGQSKADFTAKMNIALKEANETIYWLKLLYRTDCLSKSQYDSLSEDIKEILGILMAICKTAGNSK
ncbi:MAG: four helix bundle protein [Oscillospiraceae bacterium]|nr:four helix bundle protein [Oscillospiraceae bacterium]